MPNINRATGFGLGEPAMPHTTKGTENAHRSLAVVANFTTEKKPNGRKGS